MAAAAPCGHIPRDSLSDLPFSGVGQIHISTGLQSRLPASSEGVRRERNTPLLPRTWEEGSETGHTPTLSKEIISLSHFPLHPSTPSRMKGFTIKLPAPSCDSYIGVLRMSPWNGRSLPLPLLTLALVHKLKPRQRRSVSPSCCVCSFCFVY